MENKLQFWKHINESKHNIRVSDTIRFMKQIGYRLRCVRGSHHQFKHPCGALLTIVVHGTHDTSVYQLDLLIDQVIRYNLI